MLNKFDIYLSSSRTVEQCLTPIALQLKNLNYSGNNYQTNTNHYFHRNQEIIHQETHRIIARPLWWRIATVARILWHHRRCIRAHTSRRHHRSAHHRSRWMLLLLRRRHHHLWCWCIFAIYGMMRCGRTVHLRTLWCMWLVSATEIYTRTTIKLIIQFNITISNKLNKPLNWIRI